MREWAFDTEGFRDPPSLWEESYNHIEGHTLVTALADACAARGWPRDGEVFPEDWGWMVFVNREGTRYEIGASVQPSADDAPDPADWEVQPPPGTPMFAHVHVQKGRTLRQRLTGTGKMAGDDPVAEAVEAALAAHPEMRGLRRIG
jgi:hypothetical protein